MSEPGILHEIINELGPVGLLVVGLYFCLGKYLKSIADHVKTINDELGQLLEVAKEAITKCYGKN